MVRLAADYDELADRAARPVVKVLTQSLARPPEHGDDLRRASGCLGLELSYALS
jgi:hypothetical protein